MKRLMQWARQEKGRLCWLGVTAAALAFFFILRQSRAVMAFLSVHIIMPLERAIGAVCGLVEVSVAELLYMLAVALGIFYIAETIRALVKSKGRRGAVLGRFLLTVTDILLTVFLGFCLLWGTNYNVDGFQEKAGIYGRSSSVEELTRLTRYFADQVTAAADTVQRNELGIFDEDEDAIFDDSLTVYEGLYEEFPFLRLKEKRPKAIVSSRVLSAMDFTGFYFPFTGESNLNVDSPRCDLPFTIAHELAHQRGIASEQECNFLGLLASLSSGSAAYRYSGWLSGYVYAANALYRADHDAWKAIRESLPETVRRDLQYMNWYWAQFEGPVNDAATNIYDSFLKSQGDERGVQSYGTVVDLMITYYLDVHPIG